MPTAAEVSYTGVANAERLAGFGPNVSDGVELYVPPVVPSWIHILSSQLEKLE